MHGALRATYSLVAAGGVPPDQGPRSNSNKRMRDHLNHLLQLVFHTGLPLFLVVVLMILNTLLSQSGALLR